MRLCSWLLVHLPAMSSCLSLNSSSSPFDISSAKSSFSFSSLCSETSNVSPSHFLAFGNLLPLVQKVSGICTLLTVLPSTNGLTPPLMHFVGNQQVLALLVPYVVSQGPIYSLLKKCFLEYPF